MRKWQELAADMELTGSHIQRAEADETGYALTLALRPGRTAGEVTNNLPRVESVLETRPGAAKLEPDADRANRVVLRIVQNDLLSAVVRWPGSTATSLTEPLVLGRFANGEPVLLSLLGEHLLVGGATGRGKSGLLNVIVAELSVRTDAALWGIDMKLGLELSPWRPVLGRLATNEEEAFELLTVANRVLDARARLLAGRTVRKWRPSADEPALVIAVDELAELSAESLSLFERLARMGRAAGIILVAVTQRPSVEALGSLDARTQLTVRVALGVIEARDTELILGSGRLADGWRAEKLGPPGSFYVLAPGQHERPRRARAFWLDDADVSAAAHRAGRERPQVEVPTADDVFGPQGALQPAPRASAGRITDTDIDPDAALLAALGEAPHGGLSVTALARRVGRRRTWVYERLRLHEHGGRAVRLQRGR
jgi:S-DNA-T family DNA segregation ATPase FtsK/SpoIIIE